MHSLFHCSLIKVAADYIDKALGRYIDVLGISHSILQFASTHEGETLATLPSKVLWTARQAMWVTRCLFRFDVLPYTRKYHTFLCVWAQKLMELAKWPGASSLSSYFRSIRYAVLELLNTATLIPRIFMGDWFFAQQGNRRAKRWKLNKEARVAPALAGLQPCLFGEWRVFLHRWVLCENGPGGMSGGLWCLLPAAKD